MLINQRQINWFKYSFFDRIYSWRRWNLEGKWRANTRKIRFWTKGTLNYTISVEQSRDFFIESIRSQHILYISSINCYLSRVKPKENVWLREKQCNNLNVSMTLDTGFSPQNTSFDFVSTHRLLRFADYRPCYKILWLLWMYGFQKHWIHR